MANLRHLDIDAISRSMNVKMQLAKCTNFLGNYLKKNPQIELAEQMIYAFQDLPDILTSIALNLVTPDSVSTTFVKNLPIVKLNDDQLDENYNCICGEYFYKQEYVKLLTCGHYYHGECITEWCEENHYCPHCKKEIGNIASNVEGNEIQVDVVTNMLLKLLLERDPQFLRKYMIKLLSDHNEALAEYAKFV